MVSISKDPAVEFRDQLKGIDSEVQIDVKSFLKIIITNHQKPSSYTVSTAGMEEFIKIKEELREIDIQSGSEYITFLKLVNINVAIQE